MGRKIFYICKIHGGLNRSQVTKSNLYKNKRYYKCKECHRIISYKWAKLNKDKILKSIKDFKKNNNEKYKKSYMKYNRKNAHRRKFYEKEKVKNLTDRYVISKLTKGSSLKKSDIPKELIEIKRQLLLLKRLKKENKKEK